jgi:hypothetical protein
MNPELPQRPISPPSIGSVGLPPARGEFDLEKYARHTRNASVVIAVVACLFALSGLIMGILLVVSLMSLNSTVNGGNSGSAGICQSLGGTEPGC